MPEVLEVSSDNEIVAWDFPADFKARQTRTLHIRLQEHPGLQGGWEDSQRIDCVAS